MSKKKCKLKLAEDYEGDLDIKKIPSVISGTDEEKIAKWIAFYKAGIAVIEE